MKAGDAGAHACPGLAPHPRTAAATARHPHSIGRKGKQSVRSLGWITGEVTHGEKFTLQNNILKAD